MLDTYLKPKYTCSLNVTRSLPWSLDSYRGSKSELLCVLPMHSTWIVFALALFHADPAVWQQPFTLILTAGLAEVHVGVYIQSSWNIWMRWFKISGKWSVQACIDTHTRVQCSHASVGLAQARPSIKWESYSKYLQTQIHWWNKGLSFTLLPRDLSGM